MAVAQATWVACATPPGRSALALVRVSGPGVLALRDSVCRCRTATPWKPGRVRRVDLIGVDGAVFDDAVAVFAAGPRSFTGEDTLEITLHGNPLLLEKLLATCVDAGATLAAPGAFTRQAVMAGKLDLLQAEGIDQQIRATSEAGLQVAGAAPKLARHLREHRRSVVRVTAELEARLDYPADELALETDQALVDQLATLGAEARALSESYAIGRVLVDGARVALVGAVNAGKSSLFNALVGRTRALVHERPGTTRDVLECATHIGALHVTLLDTAGERETDDPIEAAGLALAAELVDEADLLVVVLRAQGALSTEEETILARTSERPRVVVYNGIDRSGARPVPPGAVATSMAREVGLNDVVAAIEHQLTHGAPPVDRLVGSMRQANLLETVADACDEAITAMEVAGVAASADVLVEALEAVDALTGADTREDVLDELFSRFCIGK